MKEDFNTPKALACIFELMQSGHAAITAGGNTRAKDLAETLIACTQFFGISHQQATMLFTPAGYHGELRPHPLRIAARIRAMLNEPGSTVAGAVSVRELIAA